MALQITISVGEKKKKRKNNLLNVKFSLKIQVSIHAGFFPSPNFQPEMSAQTLFTAPGLDFPMALSKQHLNFHFIS